MAYENGTYWYSWNFGLLRAPSAYGMAKKFRPLAIPKTLRKKGANHIGDIDVSGGLLYAGIEDGSTYLNPYVGVYDATTLKFRTSFPLPYEQQNDGVPWVAVDSAHRRILSSRYSNATEIYSYDQDTMELMGSIRLSRPLDHIQGGKVRDGFLYLSAFGSTGAPTHSVWSVELSTGIAEEIIELPADFVESEGLALPPGQIQVLGILPYGPLERGQMELCTYVPAQ